MDRDCENCKHHHERNKDDGIFYHYCDSWECKFEPKEEEKNEIV